MEWYLVKCIISIDEVVLSTVCVFMEQYLVKHMLHLGVALN